jgi:hypothetical protein
MCHSPLHESVAARLAAPDRQPRTWDTQKDQGQAIQTTEVKKIAGSK